jgi:glycosyltransferase involved in cell wall biosynthesis
MREPQTDDAGRVLLHSLTRDELERWVVEALGEKPFRAKQLWKWLYVRHASSFDEMTDLGKAVRARLSETARIDALASIGSGYELHICGRASDPAYGELLERRAAAFPVVFHGDFDVRRLGEIDADYAVIPAASHESYGLVLDEAQCLGLPVLAADVPAFREHADAQGCAFFAPNDPGSLAMLLLDVDRLGRLRAPAAAGRTPDRAAADLLSAYADARAGRSVPHEAPPCAATADRARFLFRQSERRLWSALQHGPELPPDDYLMPPDPEATEPAS